MIRRLLIPALYALLLSGCNLTVAPRNDIVSANNGEIVPSTTAPAAVSPEPPATSSPNSPPPVAAPTLAKADSCSVERTGPSRRIDVDVHIDFASKQVRVEQRIAFANNESQALAEIVLDVQANQWEGGFQLAALSVDGEQSTFTLQVNRLTIHPSAPLQPGCELDIRLDFTLQPPAIREGLRSYRGFFGYSPRQLNLGHFLPTVAARLAGAWRIHEPVGIGEQVVHEVADWQVRLSVTNAGNR